MYRLRTNFIVLISLLTALFCLGMVLFFVHVIRHKNEHASVAIATLQEKIQEKNDLSAVSKKRATIDAVDTLVGSHLVDPAKLNMFLDYIVAFGAATNTHVVVKDIKLAAKDTNTITTSISISGAFGDVEKSIALLENDTYQIHITTLSLGEIPPPAPITTKGKALLPTAPVWHADISFTVVSS